MQEIQELLWAVDEPLRAQDALVPRFPLQPLRYVLLTQALQPLQAASMPHQCGGTLTKKEQGPAR